MRRQIRGIGADARKSAGGVDLLRNALVGLGGAFVLRYLQQTSDSLTQVQNRLSLVTRDIDELRAVQQALFDVANDTRSSFEATAEVYTRAALSARNLGVSQQEVLNFTKTLNQAIILSGASAQEARNGLIQFSQGLASNALQGEELRAVLEQLPLVADIIAKEFGVSRGQLRELAADGEITAKRIFQAFGPEAQREIQEQFDQTIPTIAQALQKLENAFQEALGEVQEGFNIFRLLAETIILVAKNFDTFGRVILAGVITVSAIKATGAINALTAAIAANPIGVLVTGALLAVSALATFADQIVISSDGITTLADLVVGLAQEFKVAFTVIWDEVQPVLAGLLASLSLLANGVDISFTDILRFAINFVDRFIGVFVGIGFFLRKAREDIGGAMKAIFVGAINSIVEALEFLSDSITSVFFGIGRSFQTFGIWVSNALLALREALRQLSAGNFQEAGRFLDDAVFNIRRGTEALVASFGDNISREFNRLRQEDVLKRIEGPLAEDAREVGARLGKAFMEGFERTPLTDLFDRALVRASGRAAQRELEELQRQQADLNRGVPGGGEAIRSEADIATDRVVARLKREAELLSETIGLTFQEIEVREQLAKIREQFERRNIDYNKTHLQRIQNQIEENVVLKRASDLYRELTGAAQEARLNLEALQRLREQGVDLGPRAEFFERQFRIDELSQETDVMSGFKRGFLELQNTIGDFAAQAEATLVGAFNSAEEALVQFVQTGEFNFSRLVDSILADLTRLLARQAIFGLLGLFTRGAAGFAGTASQFFFGGARAAGGPVRRDRAYLVGERGPELFVPPSSGNIVPNGQLIQEPPQVNVNITNVTDPNEVTSALATPEGERAILNVIRRNRRAVQEVTS